MTIDHAIHDPKGLIRCRIVIISGASETGLHPVPPVADGAPEWNVFRLAEVTAKKSNSSLEILVFSPCEAQQLDALLSFPVSGHNSYHPIVFNQFQLFIYRRLLSKVYPLRLSIRRLVKLPDLMSWWYLHRVTRVLAKIKPDLVFINDRAQYIRYLRPRVEIGRLFLFMRSTIGESKRFISLLDGVVVNSNGMRTYAEQLLDDQSRTKVWYMPNTLGDEFPVPKTDSERFTGPHKTIVFAGRIIPEKGVLELLEAFRLVSAKLPNTTLFICGSSETPMRGYELDVQRRASDFSPGQVIFTGYVGNSSMGSYYTKASVAVFPSILTESFGMVALEAMRCGTPVVASRRPGFEDLIIPERTGLLVDDPRDVPGLASAILRILQNPVLAKQMGQHGYQRSLFYKPEVGFEYLESIVSNVLCTQKSTLL